MENLSWFRSPLPGSCGCVSGNDINLLGLPDTDFLFANSSAQVHVGLMITGTNMHKASSTWLGTCSTRWPLLLFHPFHSPLSTPATQRAFPSRQVDAFPRFCPRGDPHLTH